MQCNELKDKPHEGFPFLWQAQAVTLLSTNRESMLLQLVGLVMLT